MQFFAEGAFDRAGTSDYYDSFIIEHVILLPPNSVQAVLSESESAAWRFFHTALHSVVKRILLIKSVGLYSLLITSNASRFAVRTYDEKNPLLSNDKKGFLHGGRGWIRTTEVTDDRFTVCSLWPLGNSSISLLNWSWWTDLNPRPADYKSAALPTELHQRVNHLTLN